MIYLWKNGIGLLLLLLRLLLISSQLDSAISFQDYSTDYAYDFHSQQIRNKRFASDESAELYQYIDTDDNTDNTQKPAKPTDISSNPEDCQQFEAKKTAILNKIQHIFSPTKQQSEQLIVALNKIEKDNADQKNLTDTTEKKVAESCGSEWECVDSWMCKNSTESAINLRSALQKEDECQNNQICCHISDKIRTDPLPPTMKPATDKAEEKVKSCGSERECVESWMCKNSTRQPSTANAINFRSALQKEEECQNNQICCHISDKIQTDLLPPTTLKPATDKAEEKVMSCGSERECVESWMCKNTTRQPTTANAINFRSALPKEEECQNNQICCHISAKIQLDAMPACGFRNGNENGNGGQANGAGFGEFSWVVAIYTKEGYIGITYIGAGSLLAPNIVLTAAHKVAQRDISHLIARAGEWNQNSTEEFYKHQDIEVQKVLIHEEYQYDLNNIAILLLKSSFSPAPHISPICLPPATQIFDFSRCIVSGWGKDATNPQDYNQILRKITVPVLPRAQCNIKLRKILGNRFTLAASLICAGGEKGVDACVGDGGAPLICPMEGNSNRFYQAGIVAWGIGCGQEDVPAAYSNVAHLTPWVIQKLNELDIDRKFYTV